MKLTSLAKRAAFVAVLMGAAAIVYRAETRPPTVIGQAEVTDGDSLKIRGHKIRLWGIDAPEYDQICRQELGHIYPCGQVAAVNLRTRTLANDVQCRGIEYDKFERLLAVCYVGQLDLNKMMVANGWAVAYRRYSTEYVSAENTARAEKRGLWAGEFTEPEQWRHSKRNSP